MLAPMRGWLPGDRIVEPTPSPHWALYQTSFSRLTRYTPCKNINYLPPSYVYIMLRLDPGASAFVVSYLLPFVIFYG